MCSAGFFRGDHARMPLMQWSVVQTFRNRYFLLTTIYKVNLQKLILLTLFVLLQTISTMGKKWFPLESNPTLLNSFIAKLGFDTSIYSFTDVFSTEDWALDMIPQGTTAVVFLYPLTKVQEDHRSSEQEELMKKEIDQSVWHIKQRIGNACGTIGILHALANIPDSLKVAAISENSWLDKFYNACPTSMSSIEKAEVLENDDEIATKHDAATQDSQNQTGRGQLEDKLETHFVALVNVNGKVYELDGRKEKPVCHGDTKEETFLKDAASVVQKFMNRDPGEMRFTILAFAPTQN